MDRLTTRPDDKWHHANLSGHLVRCKKVNAIIVKDVLMGVKVIGSDG